MERIAYNSLLEWKNSPKRKPLILRGARQVGKTFIIDLFGKTEYAGYVFAFRTVAAAQVAGTLLFLFFTRNFFLKRKLR